MFVKVIQWTTDQDQYDSLYECERAYWSNNKEAVTLNLEPNGPRLTFEKENGEMIVKTAIYAMNDDGQTVERIYRNY